MNDIKCKRLNKIFKFVMTAAVVMIMLCAAPVMEHFGIDMGVSAHAAKSGYFTYEVEYGQATITKLDEGYYSYVTIPETLGGYPVGRLENSAFYRCEIDTFTIGENVGLIYPETFFGSFIKKYIVDPDNKNYSSDSAGCIYNKDKTILVRYPTCNERTSFVVPDGVESIYHAAFAHATYLQDIELPNSLTYIGSYAFSYCMCLTSIDIPKNVTVIDDGAFQCCTMLMNVKFPEGCETIGEQAFHTCLVLTEITIPEKVEKIGDEAFMDCVSLQTINVKSINTLIGTNALAKSEFILKNKSSLTSFVENYTMGIFNTVFGITEVANEYLAEASAYVNVYNEPQSLGVIYCKSDSSAEIYAINNNVKYGCLHTYKTKTTKATTSKNGKTVKYCIDCGNVKSSKTIYKISSIKLSATSYTYNGKVKTPSVVIKDSKGNKLVKGTDYTVKYSSGRKAVGTYKVKITFMGKYSGTKTLSFKIVLGKVTGIKSTRSGSKTTISWNKVTGATGYVVYEYNKNTGKYNKLGTFKTNSIKNNYSGRNTALKIRAYYKAKDGKVHYGAYSAKTTVKI